MTEVVEIRGKGIAGICVGWQLRERGVPFVVTGEEGVGASRAAAGLMNPVTGKGMNPGWRQQEYLDEAKSFYKTCEELLGGTYFHEAPVLRVFGSEEERKKFELKRSELDEWVGEQFDESGVGGSCWGAVEWVGGGWLDVRNFVQDSLRFFEAEQAACGLDPIALRRMVLCEGAKGLQEDGVLPTRLAKGEILTVKVPGWGENRILNRSGWVIPIGEDCYRVGANYEWEELDEVPTQEGREFAERVLRSFTDLPFEVMEHVAAVRPIVRNSQPVAGKLEEGRYLLNGLGSKGCTYAPGVARKLVELMLDKQEVDEELDVRVFLK